MLRESLGVGRKMMKKLEEINTPTTDILLVCHRYRSSRCAYSWLLEIL